MMPLHKLAAKILGLGAAFGLSLILAMMFWPFFFVAFVIALIIGHYVNMFKFVYENTKEQDGPN